MVYCRNFCSMLLIFLLGISLMGCGGKAETASKIPVPAGGFTIVLRAPTSENPQVIKVDENGKEEPIRGRRESLPEKTPVFFRVDQVNTVLYNVKITTERSPAQKPAQTSAKTPAKTQTQTPKNQNKESQLTLGIPDVRDILKVIYEPTVNECLADTIKAADQKLAALKSKLQSAKALNRELDELLYASETPKFRGFEKRKTRAADAAREKFGLTHGTARELSDKAEAVIDAVYEAWRNIEEDPSVSLPKRLCVLKELCDPSNKKAKKVVDVFAQTAKKLRMIETAKWYEDDTQEHVLSESITYTCVISSAMALPRTYPALPRLEYVVTVDKATELSGRKVTFGSFFSRFHDDTYVNVDKKIAVGVQDRFAEGFAVLTHIPVCSRDVDSLRFLKFRWAVALSGGLGLGSISDSDGSFSIGQLSTMLGVSCLFTPLKSESLLAFTVGPTIKPVQRLNGYIVGGTFPEKGGVTRPVRTPDWFFAATISYDVSEALKKIRQMIARK